jgi:hypothetical protein
MLNPDSISGADGSVVSTAPDSSGSGNNFTNPSGTDRPTLKTGILNGHNVIRFDGVNDELRGPVLSNLIGADDGTMFFVYRRLGGSGTQNILGTDSSGGVIIFENGAGNLLTFRNNDGSNDEVTHVPILGNWNIVMWRHTGGDLDGSLNDCRDASVASTTSGTTAGGVINDIPVLGRSGAATNELNGDLAFFLSFNAGLTEAEAKNVESWLANRFMLELPYDMTGLGTIGTVIFRLDDDPFIPRNTSIVLKCPYRDPDQRQSRIGAMSQLDPEPTTDYLFNSEKDGSGTNLTAQITITHVPGGNAADVTVFNVGPSDGYLTFFQLRGLGVFDDLPIVLEAENEASQLELGENTLRYNMPYQSDPTIARNAAFYLLDQHSHEETIAQIVGFIASGSDEFMRQAIAREISDRIDISDSVTGVSAPYFINGVAMAISTEGILSVAWSVVPANTSLFWVLDHPTQSQLGVSTRLAYGLFNRFWILGIATMDEDTRLG